MGPTISGLLSSIEGVAYRSQTHLGQVNRFKSQLPQAFSPIHIGLRSTGDTSTTEL